MHLGGCGHCFWAKGKPCNQSEGTEGATGLRKHLSLFPTVGRRRNPGRIQGRIVPSQKVPTTLRPDMNGSPILHIFLVGQDEIDCGTLFGTSENTLSTDTVDNECNRYQSWQTTCHCVDQSTKKGNLRWFKEFG